MQKAFIAVLLWSGVCLHLSESMRVSIEEEIIMKDAIRDMITNSFDSNEQRFLVPGIIRLCFHDCVVQCDGCIDSRRKVQGGNNGLDITWKMLRTLYQRSFSGVCSRADFFALACVVTADYAGERGEEEGLCQNPLNPDSTPMQPNICRPNMKMVWGRRTCEVAQLVEPLRNIPDADQDPYKWFDENMKMNPREAVCIMGSHALGKLRKNETGFEGNYTTRFDVLSNEYFLTMVGENTDWKQEKEFIVLDEVPQTRHQWNEPNNNLTRVNTDMLLVYDLGKLNRVGRSTCVIPPHRTNRFNPHCPKQPHYGIVAEMANNNIAFIECFGRAMEKMIHNGYAPGELVPTGQDIPPPPPSTRAPRTTTTTPRPNPIPRGRAPGRRGGNRRQGRRPQGQGRQQQQGGRLRGQQRGQQAPAGRVSSLTRLIT